MLTLRRAGRQALDSVTGTVHGLSFLLAGRRRPGIGVHYGHRRIPGAHEIVHGGLVKLQSLQARWPDDPHRFNILYLVSSRLPPGAAHMARLAKMRGVAVVLNQDGVAYPAWTDAWRQINRTMRGVLRRADHVFYQSEFSRCSTERWLGRPRGGAEILYNAVDTARFTPPSSSPEGLVLLAVGTQNAPYRVRAAVEAVAMVARERKDARLAIVGRLAWTRDEAEAREAVRVLAAAHGVADRVRIEPPFTQARAPDVYRAGHILLHAQHNDVCPGVVIEAMACGLPVVYSQSGGVPELVGEAAGIGVPSPGDGWETTPPVDGRALGAATLRVAADLDTYVRAARVRAVERFDVGAWLDRHARVFERLAPR